MKEKTEILIIGGGPGGYVAAIKGAQLGKKIILIEEDKVGGTCLNYGCIPTKALLYSTGILKEIKRGAQWGINTEIKSVDINKMREKKTRIVNQLVRGVEFLLQKNQVRLVKGRAHLESENTVKVFSEEKEYIIEADNIILATGSLPSELPFLKIDGKRVISSKEALEIKEIPEKFIIIGAGAIGLEIGLIYHRLGADVTIVEIMSTILPGNDKEIVCNLENILRRKGIKIHTKIRIEKAEINKDTIRLEGVDLENNQILNFEGSKILLAVGRKANYQNLGIDKLGIEIDDKGFIKVNTEYKTNIPSIYAIGDLIGGKLLAHKASHEGIGAIMNICGLPFEFDYLALPSAVFTEPEFSTVGLTEEEALEKGIKIKIGKFPFRANGRAVTIGQGEGIVKIIANENEEIIGAHVLGPYASELIAELSLAIRLKRKIREIGKTIHIHPTLSESIWEANLNVLKESIHILN
ncbi:dihydrolipoyl dehydrogenase [SCandidatus Aminicenantes bacterium Aminicenantia_JdfR_composite]|jgi:dihydrolipoamide dehydrogenase|nr:dihydrolipoyl dehydrogenase [SCandidatus Aminicenantes bacterium Aminicenantia_JdfR_composite]MCP2597984.1 dihydrolipoyl dehydrogenase [Candidatus Aminicenantes bacterium AC-335-L06]